MALPRKNGNACSNETAARSTKRASTRLVQPGSAFDSITSVRRFVNAAIKTTGPGNVTTGADDHVRPKLPNQAPCRNKTSRQEDESAHLRNPADVFQTCTFNER